MATLYTGSKHKNAVKLNAVTNTNFKNNAGFFLKAKLWELFLLLITISFTIGGILDFKKRGFQA